MRDLDVIDRELRLVTAAWRAARELSRRTPSTELIDQLLEERVAVAGSTIAISPDIVHAASRR